MQNVGVFAAIVPKLLRNMSKGPALWWPSSPLQTEQKCLEVIFAGSWPGWLPGNPKPKTREAMVWSRLGEAKVRDSLFLGAGPGVSLFLWLPTSPLCGSERRYPDHRLGASLTSHLSVSQGSMPGRPALLWFRLFLNTHHMPPLCLGSCCSCHQVHAVESSLSVILPILNSAATSKVSLGQND